MHLFVFEGWGKVADVVGRHSDHQKFCKANRYKTLHVSDFLLYQLTCIVGANRILATCAN